MAGFFDYLRMLLGWHSAPPVVVPPVIEGPCSPAALVYLPGATMAQASFPGAINGQHYLPGATAGGTAC